MTRFAILLSALLLQAPPFQNTRASIEGVVVHNSTARPVARASVELMVIEGPRVVSRTVTTREDGTFAFTNLPPASGYQIVVRGEGFWPTAFGQQYSRGPWTPINLKPGERLTNLRVVVPAVSRISGRVLDSLGKVQAGASVHAMRASYTEGRRELVSVANTVTSMRGEYRFGSLNPGRYYIRVSPINVAPVALLFTNPAMYDRTDPLRRDGARETEGYRTVYYPDSPVELAKPILLAPSQALDEVDIIVTKSETSRVRGTVTNEATGKRAAAAEIYLLPVGSSPDSNWSRYFESRDGTFDLRAVQPGMYFLNALAMDNDLLTAGRGTGKVAGRVVVEVRSGETHNFDVRVSPGADITGRIVIDDSTVTPDFSALTVNLASSTVEPIDGTLSRFRTDPLTAMAPVNSDGTFRLTGVTPWDYRLSLLGLRGGYIKSVRRGESDILANGLRVDGKAGSTMEIVLATDSGRLDGRVLDADRREVASARVVLVPDTRSRHDLYITATTTNTGRFQASVIPPGRYRAFAWNDVPGGAWLDPDFLAVHENRGTPVEIQSEASEYLELTLIPES